MSDEEMEAHIVGVIFAQHFSLNKGLKLFCNKADFVVQKELSQIYANGYLRVHNEVLAEMEDRRKALASLIFIT